MGFRKLKYQNKIEKHYHTDGEQQLSSFFKKKSYQNIQIEQKKDIFVMLSFYFLHKTKMYDKNEEFHFVSLFSYLRHCQMQYSIRKKLA